MTLGQRQAAGRETRADEAAAEGQAEGRAAFRAWLAGRLEWERLLRPAGTPRPSVATARRRAA